MRQATESSRFFSSSFASELYPEHLIKRFLYLIVQESKYNQNKALFLLNRFPDLAKSLTLP